MSLVDVARRVIAGGEEDLARARARAEASEAAPTSATVVEALERDGTAARLRAIAATLTAEEHQRLATEAATGDRLAALMVGVLATGGAQVEVVRCPCGGVRWAPDPSGMAERCTACGAWSPCSVVAREMP